MVVRYCRKLIMLAVVATSTVAFSQSDRNISKVLLDKGIITKQEYDELTAQSKQQDNKFKPSMKIGGRVMVDAAFFDSDDADFNNGTEIRRARIFVSGEIAQDWFYKVQYDFVYSGREGIRDMYLGYKFTDLTKIRIGNFASFGSLEDSTSSKYITFMERATPMLLFQPAVRRIGLGVNSSSKHWYAAGGVFGRRPDVDEHGDESIGCSARVAIDPVNEDRRLIHFGISGEWRNPENDTLTFKARPESHISNIKAINTISISNVNSRILYGVEFAAVYGRFSAQTEYSGISIDRKDYGSEQSYGFYVQGSWFLTGESRPYESAYGSFGRIHPEKSVGSGGIGAWEVAARYSNVDVSMYEYDGKADDITLGLNWYTTSHTRFMLNYVNSHITGNNETIDVDIVEMRAQIDF